MAAPPTINHPFSEQELSDALAEVGWGYQAFELLPSQFCPPNEARAKVELLEPGDSAVISVSERGWRICLRSVADWKRLPPDEAAKDDQSFETLDHLLAYLSPAFENRRIKLLSEKLEAISVRRDWGEGDEGDEVSPGKSEEESGKVPVEVMLPEKSEA